MKLGRLSSEIRWEGPSPGTRFVDRSNAQAPRDWHRGRGGRVPRGAGGRSRGRGRDGGRGGERERGAAAGHPRQPRHPHPRQEEEESPAREHETVAELIHVKLQNCVSDMFRISSRWGNSDNNIYLETWIDLQEHQLLGLQLCNSLDSSLSLDLIKNVVAGNIVLSIPGKSSYNWQEKSQQLVNSCEFVYVWTYSFITSNPFLEEGGIFHSYDFALYIIKSKRSHISCRYFLSRFIVKIQTSEYWLPICVASFYTLFMHP